MMNILRRVKALWTVRHARSTTAFLKAVEVLLKSGSDSTVQDLMSLPEHLNRVRLSSPELDRILRDVTAIRQDSDDFRIIFEEAQYGAYLDDITAQENGFDSAANAAAVGGDGSWAAALSAKGKRELISSRVLQVERILTTKSKR